MSKSVASCSWWVTRSITIYLLCEVGRQLIWYALYSLHPLSPIPEYLSNLPAWWPDVHLFECPSWPDSDRKMDFFCILKSWEQAQSSCNTSALKSSKMSLNKCRFLSPKNTKVTQDVPCALWPIKLKLAMAVRLWNCLQYTTSSGFGASMSHIVIWNS